MERVDKASNKTFYDTQRENDRRRFDEQASKRFVGDTLVAGVAPMLEPGAVVLDVGGGSGAYAARIARAAAVTVVGVDISESMVRQRAEDPDLPLNVVGDMESLPFASGAFDAVLFVAALHHVPDAEPALREAWRVLRPGGRVFAREPCSLRAGASAAGSIAGHPEEFRISMRYLLDRVQRAGFEPEETLGMLVTMRILDRVLRNPSLRVYEASHRLDGVLTRIPRVARLGKACLITARKPVTSAPAASRAPVASLHALLACPVCRAPLMERPSGAACTVCGALYGAEDGIPILLADGTR